MEDANILPLHWQKLYWAARKGYVVDPDCGESTSALFVSLAEPATAMDGSAKRT
jgi:hypothetical protein